MSRFDRYMLSQLLVMFGFFALVLVGVFWISRAVRLFDQLIGDGQSVIVFLEFTALGLPNLVQRVLPIAAFAATVYVTNRLNNESELTVLRATGNSPWRLARPVAVFGLITSLMLAVLLNLLVPASASQLALREAEVSRDVTSRLLTAGAFLHPSDGVTFYTRDIGADGVLRDVFLSDRRDPDARVIYTASEAYLVRQDDRTTLIMVDGLAQRLTSEDNRLSTANFRDFSYDISALIRSDSAPVPKVRTLPTSTLMALSQAEIAELTNQPTGYAAQELHTRFAHPLFVLVAALVGFATLLTSSYSRFGVWREIVIAFVLLVLIEGLRGYVTDLVRENAGLWPALYAPPVLGAGLALGLLTIAAEPPWLRRKRPEVTA